MGKCIHDGHRERVREEFFKSGIPLTMPPRKVLELILFYCMPQGDVSPLAYELIEKYGSLNSVLNAPQEELVKFKNVTDRTVMLFKMFAPVVAYCEAEKYGNKFELRDPNRLGQYVYSKFYGLKQEKMGILLMDGFYRNLGFEFVSEGDFNQTSVPVSLIAKAALNKKASAVVVAHNHPTGCALPSAADVEATERLRKVLADLGITLFDHIIIEENDYVSLKYSQGYEYLFQYE